MQNNPICLSQNIILTISHVPLVQGCNIFKIKREQTKGVSSLVNIKSSISSFTEAIFIKTQTVILVMYLYTHQNL